MSFIIPKNVSKYDIAIEIDSLDQYKKLIGTQDVYNVVSILKFIDETTKNTMKKYLTGDIAFNIIKNNVVEGNSGGSNYWCPYQEISIAAEGKKYDSLVSRIEKLKNEDKSIISEDAKRIFGEDIISFAPTTRQRIGQNIPLYAFRFVWKDDDFHPGFPNSRQRDLVLGIYDKLK